MVDPRSILHTETPYEVGRSRMPSFLDVSSPSVAPILSATGQHRSSVLQQPRLNKIFWWYVLWYRFQTLKLQAQRAYPKKVVCIDSFIDKKGKKKIIPVYWKLPFASKWHNPAIFSRMSRIGFELIVNDSVCLNQQLIPATTATFPQHQYMLRPKVSSLGTRNQTRVVRPGVSNSQKNWPWWFIGRGSRGSRKVNVPFFV
jgi:hypothetical protein